MGEKHDAKNLLTVSESAYGLATNVRVACKRCNGACSICGLTKTQEMEPSVQCSREIN